MRKLSLEEQKRLIGESKETATPLSDVLEREGLSYESLQYEATGGKRIPETSSFIPVDERQRVARSIPCVSFFSGAGGLDIGFECAGFETLVDVEVNRMFCDTLRFNGAKNVIGPPYYKGDISNCKEIIGQLTSLGIPRDFPGVFHGGPPCQSFSIAANQRYSKSGKNFKRTGFNHERYGNLLFCYINVIVYFRPEVFLIENVDGLLTIDDGEQVEKACAILSDAGYDVAPPRILNAADYGVPQNRLRTFIVGSRIGSFQFPSPHPEKVPSGTVFRRSLTHVANHATRKHSAESVERYMRLGYGKRDKLGRVDRLDPTVPSKTIIAGGTGGGGRSHLHPFIPRTMSVRECARLQTFPDHYQFTGPVARQFTQVGNAVPPVLAYEMACAIFKSIYASVKSDDRSTVDVRAENLGRAKSPPLQLTLFEKGPLYAIAQSPVTLLGTYRKTCRKWIEDNNLYNYPISDEEYLAHKELTEVERLILSNHKDEPLYFKVLGLSRVMQAELKSMGYPTNRKHPRTTQYVLYKLQKLNEPAPVYSKEDAVIVGKGLS